MAAKKSPAALVSAYEDFSREAWAQLRAQTPLTLDDDDVVRFRGVHDQLSLREVEEVYLPLSRLLNLRIAASQGLRRSRDVFLGGSARPAPFILGLAGSVAVGKSTTARILQALLSRWPDHPRVELVTTDGFLLPNRVLKARGLMKRKGFPESYDQRALVRFLSELKAGKQEVVAPVYSHLHYDVLTEQQHVLRSPDIVILEGLNVLQTRTTRADSPAPWFVSDFFDYSVYVDAPLRLIRRWYLERFLALRASAMRDPESFFHRYAKLSQREAIAFARSVWTDINERNLRDNILPTRPRAQLVLEKGEDHLVRRVRLRRF